MAHRTHLRSVGAIGRMVEAGIGVAILPESALAELDGMAVRTVPLAETWARCRLALCLRSPDGLAPHARLLMAHIKEVAAGPG